MDSLKFQEIEIAKATRDQLTQFAVLLGLEITKQNKDDIITLIKSAGYESNTICVVISASSPQSRAGGDPMQTSEVSVWSGQDEFGLKRARRMIYILIPNQDRPGGDREVPVSINGTTLYIKRNTRSLVPEEYVEALDHAVETHYDSNPDPVAEDPFSGPPRHVQRYPYQRVAIPGREAVVSPKGVPYDLANIVDVEEYKAARVEKQQEQDDRKRARLASQGLVA